MLEVQNSENRSTPRVKSDRKTEIITIAARLFKEKGYSAVTMRDIAQAMSIKAASLYNHIKSKHEILVLIIIEIAEEYTNTISQIVSSSDTTVQKLEKVIQLHIDITVRNPEALASLNNDWMHLPEDELAYFLKMREEYEEMFRKIVTDGIALGEIKNCNPEVMIFSMLSTLRTLYLWYGKKKDFNASVLRSNLREILIRGIV
ncbi:MAG: TetR/AcrR family transcriptional regulator [Flavobacterium sp.]|nr:MAG: TetR/AcrR family transcriptional regulator [Flavobacterium sp.]